MRLANGIVIDKEKTFGVLKFSALRREVHVQNEDGTVSEEINLSFVSCPRGWRAAGFRNSNCRI